MTYGVNSPLGAVASTYIGGAYVNAALPYQIATGYATSIFRGDLVVIGTNGTVTQAPAGLNAVGGALGVFNGCRYVSTNPENPYQFSPYWPASTATMPGTAIVADVYVDIGNVFDIQIGNSTNGALTLPFSAIGRTISCGFGLGNGNTTNGNIQNGISTMYADINTVSTSGNLPFIIVGFGTVPGNAPNAGTNGTNLTVPYANILVKMNNAAYAYGQTANH